MDDAANKTAQLARSRIVVQHAVPDTNRGFEQPRRDKQLSFKTVTFERLDTSQRRSRSHRHKVFAVTG